ncbi:MAG: IS66 family transposase [Bacteroidota bacterium]
MIAAFENLSREELVVKVIDLTHRLNQLEKIVFGSRHERFIPTDSPQQLALALNTQTASKPEPVKQETIQYTRRKSSPNANVQAARMTLPASLPREQVIIEPKEDVSGFRKIGEEVTEELERIPGKLFVRQYVRPKYARPSGEGIVIGELPNRPIDKGIAGPGLLAQIVIDKFCDHLPVHRQMQRFEREGMRIPYSTLSDWITGTCTLLEPLYELHRTLVLSANYLQVDETPIKVLDKNKKGTTHRGYHWVYHAPLSKQVLFDYREGRGREGPEELLRNFKGFLQVDGYSVYENFDSNKDIVLLHCMAHARRMFDKSRDNDKARAEYVLTEMQKLYALERIIKDNSLTYEDAHTLRQQEAVPILNLLRDWMTQEYPLVLPKSPIGKAISYSLQRWDKLSLYAQDGRLRVDNNLVENSIRAVAIGRKNYLFSGSHNGAQRAAMLYSFLGTCKIIGINPFEWLCDTLSRAPVHPINQLEELLPNNWAKNVKDTKK